MLIDKFINNLIDKIFAINKEDVSIITLINKDDEVIAETIISVNSISFYEYEYSRNSNEVKWKVEKKKVDSNTFNLCCKFAHKIEVIK
ncbi:hypothetical protein EXM65_09045 [Clostridium botulinum]|uniref:Uncharacterized protein n=1 Tax=Clostridium botulinum TaxID=1491 RepID=A0A6M0SQQ0_CLOBO|nr:hypothetical protein [Clostridium botulinum]